MKTLFLAIFSIMLVFLPSCSKPIPKHAIEVFVEASANSSARGIQQVIVMPVSGAKAVIVSMPIIGIDAFTNSEVLERRDPYSNEYIPGIRLRQKDESWLKIFQISGEAIGKRLFLIVDGKPIGYCRIDRQIRKDDLFFVIESKKVGAGLVEELKDLNFILNDYILESREYFEGRK